MSAQASVQCGRVSTWQLALLGVDDNRSARWRADGFLIPELPRVYAVGHAARTIESNLTAALLYAGPGAMLDGRCAGWWAGAVRDQPRDISVSTPRRVRSTPAPWGGRIVAHSRRSPERIWTPRGGKVYGATRRTALELPLTPAPRLALDLAATLSTRELRYALANLEYRELLDVTELHPMPGCRGGAALRAAIAAHDPRHARTNSPAEDELLVLCERHRLPKPDEMNTHIAGIEVDAVWHAAKLIVEIDGRGNHRTWAQAARDRRNDQTLRELGHTILRYTRGQLESEPRRVGAEIARHLAS